MKALKRTIACVAAWLAVIAWIGTGAARPVSDMEITSKMESRAGHAEAMAVLAAEPEAVWAVLTDYTHQDEFMPNVKKCTVKTRSGNRVRLAYEIGFSMFTSSYTAELEEQTRLRRLSWQAVSGDFAVNNGGWKLSPAGDNRTRLHYRVRISHRFFPDWVVLRLLVRSLPAVYDAIGRRAIDLGNPPAPDQETQKD